MSKQALVIDKEDLLKLQHIILDEHTIKFTKPTDILNSSFKLMSRNTCETDESVVQILPYITLINIETGNIFTYRRGATGEEDRIKGKMSLGLGGHVEEEPIMIYNIAEDIKFVAGLLAMNMCRELNEEVGLDLTYRLLDETQQALLAGDFRLFYSEQDQVAKHHLCLHYVLYVYTKELNSLEDCIVEPSWMPVDEVPSMELEGWSQICLKFLRDD